MTVVNTAALMHTAGVPPKDADDMARLTCCTWQVSLLNEMGMEESRAFTVSTATSVTGRHCSLSSSIPGELDLERHLSCNFYTLLNKRLHLLLLVVSP